MMYPNIQRGFAKAAFYIAMGYGVFTSVITHSSYVDATKGEDFWEAATHKCKQGAIAACSAVPGAGIGVGAAILFGTAAPGVGTAPVRTSTEQPTMKP